MGLSFYIMRNSYIYKIIEFEKGEVYDNIRLYKNKHCSYWER